MNISVPFIVKPKEESNAIPHQKSVRKAVAVPSPLCDRVRKVKYWAVAFVSTAKSVLLPVFQVYSILLKGNCRGILNICVNSNIIYLINKGNTGFLQLFDTLCILRGFLKCVFCWTVLGRILHMNELA